MSKYIDDIYARCCRAYDALHFQHIFHKINNNSFRSQGIFKIVDSVKVATLWGKRKVILIF